VAGGGAGRFALQALRGLAGAGHYRLKPVGVMIAVCAHKAVGGVLHCDGGCGILAGKTGLVCGSGWLVPAGDVVALGRAEPLR
jgi:hypothetical protein